MVKANKHSYEFEIDQCDVVNKFLLQTFRTKYSEWIEWYADDPHHSICDQISSMMWNDAAYRSLNEARRFASEQNPSASRNGMLGEFLDRGYVSTQILDLYKITEKSPLSGPKAVISLRRLIDDMAANRHLLTRENFVSFDGLPFDCDAAREAYYSSLSTEEMRSPHWLPMKGPQGWGMSERVHAAFDQLSGVDPKNRKRHDIMNEKVFQTLSSWLDAPILETLRTHRNKYIGHAADAVSRQVKPLSRLGVSLNEIAEAQRIVIRVANGIGSTVLYHHGVGSPVPTPQFDVFENFDLPLVPEKHMQDLSEWWDAHEREREAWLREHIDFLSGAIVPY